MRIKFAEIKKEIKKIWPELHWTLPTDPEYWTPTLQEIQDFINTQENDIPYTKGIYECEEFAIGLMSDLRRWRAKKVINEDKSNHLNWAVGIALTIKSGLSGDQVHYQNIALTSDKGIVLIEPQGNTITELERVKKVHFVLM